MLEALDKIDQRLLVFLNNCHSPFWDEVMLKSTDRFFWIPFYILIIVFLIWKFKKDSFLLIAAISLLIICSDLFTSSFMKPFFERLRPCYNDSISGSLHMITGCGGKYGFVSSHASNTFALAFFLVLILRKIYRWIYLIIIWSTLVSYSRVYLGVHYPGDILAGATIGVILSMLTYKIYAWGAYKLKSTYSPL